LSFSLKEVSSSDEIIICSMLYHHQSSGVIREVGMDLLTAEVEVDLLDALRDAFCPRASLGSVLFFSILIDVVNQGEYSRDSSTYLDSMLFCFLACLLFVVLAFLFGTLFVLKFFFQCFGEERLLLC